MRLLMFLLLLARTGSAQTHCDTLEHDNRILRKVTVLQDKQLLGRGILIDSLTARSTLSDQAIADLEKRGSAGLSKLLTRSVVAEARAAELQTELNKWRPSTWIGRVWFKAQKPLSYVGGAVVGYYGYRIFLQF